MTQAAIHKHKREFDFEKLDVYKLALDFLDQVFVVYKALPGDLRFSLGDQFVRAALSISNNLAEGSGKQSSKERSRYYSIALDSTRECVSILNVLGRQQLIATDQHEVLREVCWRISSMLFRLRSVNGTR